MGVEFENLIVGNGTFKEVANIELVTVPANSTVAKGSVLGQNTDGKYLLSDDGASDGSEVAVAIAGADVVNDTGSDADIKALVFKAGSFNALGVTFGGAHTLETTKDSLHKVSIELTKGVK
jgi:hypothetical protein